MLAPMLAASKFVPKKVEFPVFIQPKFDGIRCLVYNGGGMSRTLKPIPNSTIQAFIWEYKDYLEGFDGELVVGGATEADAFRSTTSIMARDGSPNFTYHVFDCVHHTVADRHYEMRLNILRAKFEQHPLAVSGRVKLARTVLITSMESLMIYEGELVAEGYEGAIIRSPYGPYKSGRATASEGYLTKIKRFVDGEAEIIGFEELCSNQNEALKDNLGHTKRSSHQENKIPQDTLGAFIVRNLKGIEFRIGTGQGLTHERRKEIWLQRGSYLGKIAKFKYQEVGGYDKPRMPVWIGFRHQDDM